MFGRLSLSVGGARRTLTAVPGGARGRPACGGAPVARSELLAAAVVAAQASEEVCGAGGRAAAALWGCQSAAASNSLSPPQVPRRPSRLLQFRRLLLRGPLTHVFSNTHCVARLLFQPRCRRPAKWATDAASRAHPSRHTRAHPGLIGVLWKHRALHRAHRGARLAAARRHTHTNLRKPPTPPPRRLERKHNTTYKTS